MIKNNNNVLVFLGVPINFQNKCFVFPPKVKEVISNEQDFYKFQSILTMSQEDINDMFLTDGQGNIINKDNNIKIPTPLQHLMINCMKNKEYEELVKKAFLFFTKSVITLSYKENIIFLGDLQEELLQVKSPGDLRYIDENNFFDFQNIIRAVTGQEQVESPNPNEHPRIKAMKAKARYRDKVKAKGGKNGISYGTVLQSLCFMNIGINPINIGDISYGSVGKLTEMYRNKEAYELDIKQLLAGASSKKIKPKHWIKD